MVARWQGCWRQGEKGEGPKYKLSITKWSQGCTEQHREYSQHHCYNYGWCQVAARLNWGITL